ncbi:hypothetical protein, partial [Mesorhizobium sp.]|uniref:hypothetical protein n=1 Tax=Mesorhizobium sp. TaxID=1871066 RepID=UPI0025C5CF84
MMSTMALPMQSTSYSGINISAWEPAGFLPRRPGAGLAGRSHFAYQNRQPFRYARFPSSRPSPCLTFRV